MTVASDGSGKEQKSGLEGIGYGAFQLGESDREGSSGGGGSAQQSLLTVATQATDAFPSQL